MDFAKLSPKQKQYALAIADKAREMGVDPELALAVASAESSFDPSALGPPIKGDPNRRAIGLMQIDPVNAKGLKMTLEDLADPDKNIAAGVQILRENLDRYKGHTRAALVAYNSSLATAKKYLDSDEDFSTLPLKTKKYLEDIDAIRNTDVVGYANKGDLTPTGGPVMLAGASGKFGELPPREEGQPPIEEEIVAPSAPPSKFGEIDELGVANQPDPTVTPPVKPEPSLYERANTAATDVYKAAKENPELTGAVAASGTAGLLLGQYGKDTLDKQTEALDKAKRDLLLAEKQREVGNRINSRFTGESTQALDELDDLLAQRKQDVAMREEELRKLQAQLAEKAPPDLKGAQKWTSTMGGDDVPLEQKMQAENMRSNNPKGGQAIIDQNTAAKQRLEKMGLSNFSLTEPAPGQLAVPDEIAAERKAKLLAEQQAQSKAVLEAQRKAEIARQQMEETQRLHEQATKAHAKTMSTSSKSAAELGGEVEIARTMERDAAKRAPTGLGKAGVFAGKVAGKTIGALSGIAVPLAADEAFKRRASGDYVGAVLSAAEAVTAVMAMLPPGTPLTAGLKAAGIGGGLAIAVIDHFRNKGGKPAATAPKPANTPPRPPSGGLSQYQERKPNGIYKDAYGRYHG
jgi:hypothetical protein